MSSSVSSANVHIRRLAGLQVIRFSCLEGGARAPCAPPHGSAPARHLSSRCSHVFTYHDKKRLDLSSILQTRSESDICNRRFLRRPRGTLRPAYPGPNTTRHSSHETCRKTFHAGFLELIVFLHDLTHMQFKHGSSMF